MNRRALLILGLLFLASRSGSERDFDQELDCDERDEDADEREDCEEEEEQKKQ